MIAIPAFKNQQLLTTSLTHRSALNESLSESTDSNERLEFLGDAVLELVTTEFLYQEFPDEQEGILTAYRSALVKTTTLAEVARELDLGSQILMSKGEETSGGRQNEGMLADTTEAVIGALYLDQGVEAVRRFLNEALFPKFAEIKAQKLYKDPKSLLQESVQSQGLSTPEYVVTKEFGPDHDKEFIVEAVVNGKVMGSGQGRSKQAAQQAAAAQALEKYSRE